MAIDAYLQIEGIKGESTDEKHKDWIEISHVMYGVHQPRAATISTAGGHTSGRAELQNIMFKKLSDLSSLSCFRHAQLVRRFQKLYLNSCEQMATASLSLTSRLSLRT